jgi:hypothetical protein
MNDEVKAIGLYFRVPRSYFIVISFAPSPASDT